MVFAVPLKSVATHDVGQVILEQTPVRYRNWGPSSRVSQE